MNTTRGCGCKGYRSCRICEEQFGIVSQDVGQERAAQFKKRAGLCLDCGQVFYGLEAAIQSDCSSCSAHLDLNPFEITGLTVIPNFVTEAEEASLLADLDSLKWDTSQSGRRKQNFGPRANFKKRKVKAGQNFKGFPKQTQFVQDRFSQVPLLDGYQTVEQCSIEYRPETGARIDPHIDDCWVWGERIVQLNMASDSVLTLFPYCDSLQGDKSKYNLADVATFPKVVKDDRVVAPTSQDASPYSFKDGLDMEVMVRVPLPPRSLLVMYGEARYQWEHCVLRSDISSRRVIIAYRELTPPYLSGGIDQATGDQIVARAKLFW